MTPSAFSSTLALPLRPTSKSADCWDQIAKFGRFVKDDGEGPQEALFNLEHLGEFMTNWVRQPNPLWADANHDFGECLARYNALALVSDGVVVRQVSHGDVAAPTHDELLNPESGVVEDGLYAHRFELTRAGQKRLPNVFYVSPFFVTNGRDEQGNSIGYELLNIAFVNGPFLRGMAPLRMSKTRGIQFMADDKMKRYGVDENASAENLRAAMSRYADEVDDEKKRSEESMSRYRRFADACGGEERMQRFLDDEEEQKRFRKFMSGDDGDKDDDEREMSVLASELGVPAKMSAIRTKLTELRFTSVPKSELAALKEQLSELKAKQAKRDEEEREAATLAFARKAIADRAWDPEDEAGLVAFYRASPEKATEAVERNKKHKTWERVIAMARLTAGGAPVGKPEGEVLDLSKSEPADLGKKIDEVARKIAADENVPYSVAMTRVKVKHPQLYAAFVAAR